MEAQTAMTMSPKAVSKLRNLIAHYIRGASRWSTIPKHKAKSSKGWHLTTRLSRRKFSASLAHETLSAVYNCGWCRIGHVWKRHDALSRKASAG